MLADTSAQQRDLAGLQKYAALAGQHAVQLKHTLYEGVAHRALGVMQRLLGNRGESEKELYHAVALFKGLGTRWQSGRTYLELGDLAIDGGDASTASAHYAEALKAFEEMQAKPAVEQVRKKLESLGR